MYFLYNIILAIAALLLLPYYLLRMLLTGKYRKSLGQKFGLIPPGSITVMRGSPRIWIHAVSVGEVTAAAPVVVNLRSRLPGACIVLSTSTETGREMAEKMITEATAMVYFPLDIPFVVRKVIALVKPDVFAMIETELWPNFIRACHKRSVKIVLVNGRISPRSFRRYAMTRFFWMPVLDKIDVAGVISDTDARRLIDLGLSPSRIHVFGNAKYDSFAAKASPDLQKMISEKLDIRTGEKVLVAGSTHDGEEQVILSVYKKLLNVYPDFKLISVPRHPERAQAVAVMAQKEGLEDIIMMSEINGGKRRTTEKVIIVDVIGELFRIYSLAAMVYCGGSLVPKGGQNILEPAAWGKVVFFGPHMEDFQDEKTLLEASGAGITIRDGNELFERMVRLIQDQTVLAALEEKGREVIIANKGAAEKYTGLIMQSLSHKASQG
ncbi:MAG: 3-deoxy-D-manno-octulosonic acid transferase [Deltaproteobacteria bacterium]|nr:3-deoxy-D-manno-octulosonic acid transferase [Deltaproteobacteria bacterium]